MAEDFSPSAQIKSHKIVFRPDPKLKKEVAKEFKLKRISSVVNRRPKREHSQTGLAMPSKEEEKPAKQD